MTSAVFLFRASRAEGGRDLFSCLPFQWRLLHRLATTFGWRPAGTTYRQPDNASVAVAARHSYGPGVEGDIKTVDREDAFDWARALEDARSSSQLETILGAHPETDAEAVAGSSDALRILLDEFIQYAYGGSFNFVARDQGGPQRVL